MAILEFNTNNILVGVGQEFNIALNLNPKGESVNAIELEIKFPNDLLSSTGSITGDSIVSLWIERPEAKAGEISLSGIIPGGFAGVSEPGTESLAPGHVASFIFLAKKEGVGEISIVNAKIIRNDGKATILPVRLSSSTVSISKEIKETDSVSSPSSSVFTQDQIPPEPFKPQIINSPEIADNEAVLIFDTIDKQTGVDYYEVKLGSQEFIRAESPYVLKAEYIGATIEVKAIDHAGNQRVESVVVGGSQISASGWPLALGAIVLILLAIWLKRKFTFHTL